MLLTEYRKMNGQIIVSTEGFSLTIDETPIMFIKLIFSTVMDEVLVIMEQILMIWSNKQSRI